MKTKNYRLNSLLLTAIGCTISLTGCLTTMPTGIPSMMPSVTPTSMGGLPTVGVPLGGAMQSSGGANWAGRDLFGTGGIMGVNAEKFASNVHNLEIGKSSREDALAYLGAPMSKSAQGSMEAWTYGLFNNGANEGFAQVFFKKNFIQYISVIKTSLQGGSISSEVIFTKGSKPNIQDML